jgi:hypothetical protein
MKKALALAAAATLACSGAALAHHAHANYFQDRYIQLSGEVTNVHWLNPHVWLTLDVTAANGQKTTWMLEGTGIAGLMAKGWRPDSIKVRDKISVRCHPLKDGDEGCLMGFVTGINGVAMDKEFN